MKLNKEQVQKLAHLARLDFSEQELDAMMSDLDKMLQFVERINELDLEGVEPLVYVNDEVDKLRPDEERLYTSKEDALRNAPDRDTDYFRVPRVLKDE